MMTRRASHQQQIAQNQNQEHEKESRWIHAGAIVGLVPDPRGRLVEGRIDPEPALQRHELVDGGDRLSDVVEVLDGVGPRAVLLLSLVVEEGAVAVFP